MNVNGMFDFDNTSAKGNNQRTVEEKFVVVYDKLTKPVAISLRNSLDSKYTCTIWDKKTYIANEMKLSSQNYLIILNEELIVQNLANPNLKPIKYINGIVMLVEGNTLGLKFDPSTSPKKLNGNWYTYLESVVAPMLMIPKIPIAIPSVIVASLLAQLYLKPIKEKIKLKLFFDAIDKLKKESLELFLNGKLG